MASEVGICNRALSMVGAANIEALTEGSASANACQALYETIRDELLESSDWFFATTRVKIPRLAAAPAFGFDYAYEIPAECLRTVEIYDADERTLQETDFRREGRQILSDAEDIYLVYVKQETDPNQMTSAFREALSAKLAVVLAIRLANSSALAERLATIEGAALARALATDARQQGAPVIPDGSWITDRER